MPESREYQFPAFAAVQGYIRNFLPKFESYDTAPHIPNKKYELHYRLDNIKKEDLDFFRSIGLRLEQEPEEIPYPDAIIDLTERRINLFCTDRDRNVGDVYGIMTGASSTSIPEIRNVQNGRETWGNLCNLYCPFPNRPITGDEIALLGNGEIAGIIGYQSWETYLAAAMGLPVIEILPEHRKRSLFSKWWNPKYRMVIESEGSIIKQFQQAHANLTCSFPAHQKVDEKLIQMERTPCSAGSVSSL